LLSGKTADTMATTDQRIGYDSLPVIESTYQLMTKNKRGLSPRTVAKKA
jgi:hypothetical protein